MVVAVDAHMVAHMAVPKAACSSVKATLATIDPEVPDDTVRSFETDVMAVHRLIPTRRHRATRRRQYEGWFRFTVARDALRRMLSLDTDLIAGRTILRQSASFRHERARLPQDPDPDAFFLNLADYVQWASVVKHHALPMRLFIGPDLGAYDRPTEPGKCRRWARTSGV